MTDVTAIGSEFWDRYARLLSNVWDDFPPMRAMFDDILRAAGLIGPGSDPSSKRVLDLGCGPGFLLRALNAHNVRPAGVILVDRSASMLAFARQVQYPGVVAFRQLDVETSLEAVGLIRGYDIITASHLAYALGDPVGFFTGVRRLLAPGDIFIDTTPRPGASEQELVGALSEWFVEHGLDPQAGLTAFMDQHGELFALQRVIRENFPHFSPDEDEYRGWFMEADFDYVDLSTTFAGQDYMGVARCLS